MIMIPSYVTNRSADTQLKTTTSAQEPSPILSEQPPPVSRMKAFTIIAVCVTLLMGSTGAAPLDGRLDISNGTSTPVINVIVPPDTGYGGVHMFFMYIRKLLVH